MKTTPLGVAFIEHHEGVVLRAYRDVVGVWTIGAGLTAASGVIVPKSGMVITKDEASALLASALRAKYEPSVATAMTRKVGALFEAPKPHEFDAAVSFHWNTGAIQKASWVTAWAQGALPAVIRQKLALWNKGGGKVLPGLVRRREEEAAMLLEGIYPTAVRSPSPVVPPAAFAAWALTLSPGEKTATRDALNKLGYNAGSMPAMVNLDAAKAFQRDHSLTVDGILGRATLSTLQRRLDASKATVAPLAVLAAAAPVGVSGLMSELTGLPMTDGVGVALAVALAAKAAWSYRDTAAHNVSSFSPRLAAFLRSF